MINTTTSSESEYTGKQLILSAFNNDRLDRYPIWFMRQAGRYLPEYRTIREGKSFEKLVMNPEFAATVTMQPVKRFNLDAAIIFSDILVPLYGMKKGLKIIPSVGPRLKYPIKSAEEIDDLIITTAKEDFSYLPESIRLVRNLIPEKALIGFAGAPFTLASYLIEGKSTKTALVTKSFAYNHPNSFDKLLHILSDIVIDQLNSQVKNGVDLIQLFDSWAGFLSPPQYKKWVLPHIQYIFRHFQQVPTILYARGSSHLLEIFNDAGSKGISIDSTISLTSALNKTKNKIVLQGNLDPAVLLTKPELVRSATWKLLNEMNELGVNNYIFNLAQGIDKYSKLENVHEMVSSVKNFRRN